MKLLPRVQQQGDKEKRVSGGAGTLPRAQRWGSRPPGTWSFGASLSLHLTPPLIPVSPNPAQAPHLPRLHHHAGGAAPASTKGLSAAR